MQIVENGDDDDEPRFSNGSMACLFLPTLACIDSQPRNSLSYNKLPPEPLRLTILKLDGTSFGIKLARTGTVGELKRTVEESFHHFPKKGPSKISCHSIFLDVRFESGICFDCGSLLASHPDWKRPSRLLEHVWGQFCLCHNGHKLLTDSDYIGLCGIKDGDQLRFKHHASNSYNLGRTPIEKENSDSDDELNSNGYNGSQKNGEENDVHCKEISKDNQEDDVESDNGISSHREHRITHLLKGWFSYRKLTSSRIKIKESSSSSRFSKKTARKS